MTITNEDEKGIPAVIIFAGPNGSGKSTITEAVVGDPEQFSGEYINADDIARSLQDQIADYRERNLKAAQIAEERRLQALHDGRDFAFETVMSTPEKVALMTQAKALGYRVSLFFVTTEDPEINVRRVAGRVADGGHAVDPDAIRRRYAATMELLPAAFEHADQATVIDNSESPGNLRIVASKADDEVEFPVEDAVLPWVAEKLTEPYMRRLASRKLLSAALSDGRPVEVAEAANGKDYQGMVVRVTEYHVLQEVAGALLLHDRQLAATATYTQGSEQTVSYRYEHGKIVPIDADNQHLNRPNSPK
ncbi:zeta toxin family protein [Paraburkholderia hospita]|uniref:zeta toxin family protein n=1 Tax=Paraburkholderia hospita TaxID=169430 RepID=UPI0008A79289|nr:zeta toxin family protein [Paraburkholderia hospita]SEI14578.1 Predicted ABC-type ATPase [Paraburkholderia hospita]